MTMALICDYRRNLNLTFFLTWLKIIEMIYNPGCLPN